jgi:hypothetical protein
MVEIALLSVECVRISLVAFGLGDIQVFAYPLDEPPSNLSLSGDDRASLTTLWTIENRMLAAFSFNAAPVFFKMLHEVSILHEATFNTV